MWKQRSRNTYLQEGDCNTKFFHSKASSRYHRNTIEGLFDEEDVWQEDAKKVKHIVLNYYSDLFTSSNPTDFQELLDAIPPKVLVEIRGGKVSPNPFAHPNPTTLIEPNPTQLLVELNGHQPNQTK